MAPEVTKHVFGGPGELALGAADWIAATLARTIAVRGEASLVLAGGSTPAATYSALAGLPVDWRAVRLYWGDERCVPPTESASNYRMARETLLDPAGVPADNVYRIEGERPSAEAADAYERLLRERFDGRLPSFDLVLLGVGTDGHVASLFPGQEERWNRRWVVAVDQPAAVERVTLGLDLLAAARCLGLLVSGAGKAAIVQRLVAAPAGELPAAAVIERASSVVWLLDRQAAGSVV